MPKKTSSDSWNFRKRLSLAYGVGRNIMALKTTRTEISGIGPGDWMSVLQPLAPFLPVVDGWQWDRPVGWNIFYTPKPRADERYTFRQLRAMAANCEMLRLVIETRKDQMGSMKWKIKFKDEGKIKDSDNDDGVKAITEFFQSPDQSHDFDEWLRMIIEELSVTDAVTIMRQKTRGGKTHAFELLDGSTIFPLMDESGRRPMSPNPAYQQILKGVPKANFTTDELIYKPRNLKITSPYGFSPTEQVMTMAKMYIERNMSQLAYFTDGNVPDSYATLPKEMTADQLESFDQHFKNMLSGNNEEKRKILTGPEGMEIKPLKAPLLKDEFDEWIARIICFAFSMAPTPFVKQNNRATADTAKEQAAAEGLEPIMIWVKRLMDKFIREDFKRPDLEWAWVDDTEQDPQVMANIATEKVKTGQWTINESRDKDGLDPVEGGDVPLVMTATGYVEITNRPPPPQPGMQDGENGPNDAAPSGKTGNSPPNKPKQVANQKNPANKLALTHENGHEHGLDKAVSLPAIPFPRQNTDQAAIDLADLIAPILEDTGRRAAAQVRGLAEKLAKAGDDDEDDSDTLTEAEIAANAKEISDGIALDHLDDLTSIMPSKLTEIAADTGRQTVKAIVTTENSGLVNQVFTRAVTYAEERAAEMVGMRKHPDGTLVPNPNAKFRIDTATRDMLRQTITDGLKQNIGMDAIADNIAASEAFSPARAQLIARTEIAMANGMGAIAGYKVAKQYGVDIKKLWKTDENPCPVCVANAEIGPIDIEDEFPSGNQSTPAHPWCECVTQPVIGKEPKDESFTARGGE